MSSDFFTTVVAVPISPVVPITPMMPITPMVPIPFPCPIRMQSNTDVNATFSNTSMVDETFALKKQGYATGLATALVRSTRTVHPLRIWVVDNSGSMAIGDGTRLVDCGGPSKLKSVPCSRWDELSLAVEYHSQISALISAPTTFRLLNGSLGGDSDFLVGENADDMERAMDTMAKASPGGATPLTEHVYAIREMIAPMAPNLRAKGQRVVVVIATDGLPTNAEGYGGGEETNRFVTALRSLEGLPVWVVIRLCTDSKQVATFYNELDSQLEMSLEVIDDFFHEAKEVHRHNPWLNYCLPLHRAREFGFQDRVLDYIDERPLSVADLKKFCAMLFGDEKLSAIDPAQDWQMFSERVEFLVKNEKLNFNPIKKKEKPWISIGAMNRMYGPPSACVLM